MRHNDRKGIDRLRGQVHEEARQPRGHKIVPPESVPPPHPLAVGVEMVEIDVSEETGEPVLIAENQHLPMGVAHREEPGKLVPELHQPEVVQVHPIEMGCRRALSMIPTPAAEPRPEDEGGGDQPQNGAGRQGEEGDDAPHARGGRDHEADHEHEARDTDPKNNPTDGRVLGPRHLLGCRFGVVAETTPLILHLDGGGLLRRGLMAPSVPAGARTSPRNIRNRHENSNFAGKETGRCGHKGREALVACGIADSRGMGCDVGYGSLTPTHPVRTRLHVIGMLT